MSGEAKVVLVPCRVPWAISPSGSCATLAHSETDVSPRCTVTVGAGRLTDAELVDSRLIAIEFECCYFTRTGPKPDGDGVECLGYDMATRFEGAIHEYLDWRRTEWRKTGFCPDSGFYVATHSVWLESIPARYRNSSRHFVVKGRDGYVELIARHYKWREQSGPWMPEEDFTFRDPNNVG